MDIDLGGIRNDVYSGRGYHVIRNWIGAPHAAFLVDFWQNGANREAKAVQKHRDFVVGCPDFSTVTPDRRTHFNFFWNAPQDRATYDVSWRLQELRNRIEGRPASSDFFPSESDNLPIPGLNGTAFRAACYRVTGTLGRNAVGPHRDWEHDPSRVQLALNLSRKGEDYSSGGFRLTDRQGNGVDVASAEDLHAGDLVIFHYPLLHEVVDVETKHGQRGFWRLLMPIETIYPKHRLIAAIDRGHDLGGRVRSIAKEVRRMLPREEPKARFEVAPGIQRLIDVAIEEGCDPADCYHPNGLFARWQVMQDWQVQILAKLGLAPQHRFLDIGTGPMRLGLKLVPFLEENHYCGVEPLERYVALGRRFAADLLPGGKQFDVRHDHTFDFAVFGQKFDFAMSHSVFTHVDKTDITRCFERLRPVMAPGGKLVFTVIIDSNLEFDRTESFLYDAVNPMVRTIHKDATFFRELGEKHGFRIEELGRAGHPSQSVIVAHF